MQDSLCGSDIYMFISSLFETDPEYWIRSGQEELLRALDNKVYKGEAKNVILFLGDGMGLSTITASRIYKGQLAGRPGEEERLVFEDFPNVALAKVNNVFRK